MTQSHSRKGILSLSSSGRQLTCIQPEGLNDLLKTDKDTGQVLTEAAVDTLDMLLKEIRHGEWRVPIAYTAILDFSVRSGVV